MQTLTLALILALTPLPAFADCQSDLAFLRGLVLAHYAAERGLTVDEATLGMRADFARWEAVGARVIARDPRARAAADRLAGSECEPSRWGRERSNEIAEHEWRKLEGDQE